MSLSFAQGNCLLYPENSGERIACELSYRAIEYSQGSKESQIIFDKAIEIGPGCDYAYYQKSVPFFKRGMLAEGVRLISKAIDIKPLDHLCYRAYWYYSHDSYAACIRDLERYYYDLNGPLKFIPGGEIEMRMYLAMSYVAKGRADDGLRVAQESMAAQSKGAGGYVGQYDYYLLGYLYYLNGKIDESIAALSTQLEENKDFRDTYYLLAKCYEKKGERAKAKEYYQECLDRLDGTKRGYTRTDVGLNLDAETVRGEMQSL